MAPSLLDATCVAKATTDHNSNSTSSLTYHNLTSCLVYVEKTRNITNLSTSQFWGIIFGSIFAFIAVCIMFYFCGSSSRTLRLRYIPSYELHEHVEECYGSSVFASLPERFRIGPMGRYVSVTYRDDAVTSLRTITIVENLDRIPKELEPKRGVLTRARNLTPAPVLEPLIQVPTPAYQVVPRRLLRQF